MNKLEVKNLTKIFNGKLAINKINFSLLENTILGIKWGLMVQVNQQLLYCFGLIKQTSGKIYINDTCISKQNRLKFLNIMNFMISFTEFPKDFQ